MTSNTLQISDYKVVVSAGTYEGVLAGWEVDTNSQKADTPSADDHHADDNNFFRIAFASPIHEGSIRSVATASTADPNVPGVLLSCGYDEMLRTHDFTKHQTSLGEVRTPADFGTPIASSFAPPTGDVSTHCLVAFSGGKLVIYKKRDWSVQHVLAGHEHGIASLCVHPSGKMVRSVSFPFVSCGADSSRFA